jgi:hypothetical protein
MERQCTARSLRTLIRVSTLSTLRSGGMESFRDDALVQSLFAGGP